LLQLHFLLPIKQTHNLSKDGLFPEVKKKVMKSVYKSGGVSAYLESKDSEIKGFGTLMQTCSAENYLGKRVKMTAYIKTQNVVNKAGMWLRVDSKESKK